MGGLDSQAVVGGGPLNRKLGTVEILEAPWRATKRPLLRADFWEDHAHELTLYARGVLKDVERPVGKYRGRRSVEVTL